MTTRTDTVQVSGIRCERCVGRLAAALQDHEGLEAASATLMGEVTLRFEDEQTSLPALVEVLRKAGFAPLGEPRAGAGISAA